MPQCLFLQAFHKDHSPFSSPIACRISETANEQGQIKELTYARIALDLREPGLETHVYHRKANLLKRIP